MRISVFLSYPKPHTVEQGAFVERLCAILNGRGLLPRTLGVTDYNMEAPLTSIRGLMLESNGLIAIGLRRTRIDTGILRPDANIQGAESKEICGAYLTSPWCHIEPAMAFQLGLPVLLFRECGVVEDGVFDRGVIGQYMPQFSITNDLDSYFNSLEFCDILGQWEAFVRRVHRSKGQAPCLWA